MEVAMHDKEAPDVHMNDVLGLSFKEILLDRDEPKVSLSDDNLLSDEEENLCAEEEEDDCPTILLSRDENIRMRKSWKQTLIIKLLGRSIGHNYLFRIVKELWKAKGSIDLVALDNDFYIAKLSFKNDYDFALFEGPWMVVDHYLTVRRWYPNFDTTQDTVEQLLVWVRLPCCQWNTIIEIS
ncbi:conserved hypothetical protein [Ricinus communis]|uniref:DUF4283 domain-containing protein n=1 Tax=Ricinus communis TaxID=3988 RepID=B9T835_RICCO|nr:conserved hypothetical protein [Ricinus communis]